MWLRSAPSSDQWTSRCVTLLANVCAAVSQSPRLDQRRSSNKKYVRERKNDREKQRDSEKDRQRKTERDRKNTEMEREG